MKSTSRSNNTVSQTSRQMAQDKKDSGGGGGGSIITKRGNTNLDKIETSSSAAAMLQLEVPLGSKKGTPTPVSTSSIINSSQGGTAPSVKIQP